MRAAASFETWVRALTLLPIVVCSIAGFGLALAKWVQLRHSRRGGDRALLRVRRFIGAREYARALATVRTDRSHAARLIEQALTAAEAPRGRLASHIEQGGRQLARELDYGLGGLALIATLGPLLGLFGTVVGIVLVFERLAGVEGVISPQQLAGGIGTALYTTVAGLIVGMCALVSHRCLAALVDGVTAQLEAIGEQLVDLIREDES